MKHEINIKDNKVYINGALINRSFITKEIMKQSHENAEDACIWALAANVRLAGVKSTDLTETEYSMMAPGGSFNFRCANAIEMAIATSVEAEDDEEYTETILQIIWVILRDFEKANGEEVLDYFEWNRKNTEAD